MYHVHIIKYHGRSSAKLTVIQSSIDHHGHLGNLDNLGDHRYILVEDVHPCLYYSCPRLESPKLVPHLPAVSPHSAVPGAWFPAVLALRWAPHLSCYLGPGYQCRHLHSCSRHHAAPAPAAALPRPGDRGPAHHHHQHRHQAPRG